MQTGKLALAISIIFCGIKYHKACPEWHSVDTKRVPETAQMLVKSHLVCGFLNFEQLSHAIQLSNGIHMLQPCPGIS